MREFVQTIKYGIWAHQCHALLLARHNVTNVSRDSVVTHYDPTHHTSTVNSVTIESVLH